MNGLDRHRPLLLAAGLGASGGALFFLVGAPLPWLLGALVSTTVAALAGFRVEFPRRLRNLFIPVLGVTLAATFDFSVLAEPMRLALIAFLVLLFLTVTTCTGFLFFRLVAGYDGPTAYFSSIPGGLSEVVVLAEAMRADVRAVALVHAVRLAVAIPLIVLVLQRSFGLDGVAPTNGRGDGLSAPDIAILAACAIGGYMLGLRLRLPAPQLFGPLFLGAGVYSAGLVGGAPPLWLIAVAQLVIGTFIGVRFSGTRFAEVRRTLLWSSCWAMVLLMIVAGFAFSVSAALAIPPRAVFLAFSPGGAAEISMLALAAGADLDLVMTVQFLRIGLTILLGPMVIRSLSSGHRKK